MSSSESAPSLLEQLRAKYGVDESLRLYGPSVVVPNRDYRPEWSRLLSQAGYRIYCGERDGRVAWVIPLKAKHDTSADLEDPRGDEVSQMTPTPRAYQGEAPSKGCITGRPWTQAEDEQLLAMLKAGRKVMEIVKELAVKLGRTERAVKTRLLKLKRRKGVGSNPMPSLEKPEESPIQPKPEPAPSQERLELRSLIESALLLAEDPKHHPALRLILEACLSHIARG